MVTKRQLAADLDDAKGEASRLRLRVQTISDERDTAKNRLQLALGIIMNGQANLETLFGDLTNMGVDENDQVLRYAANDGLAFIHLNPATGQVTVTDPQDNVESITVTFDQYGQLDRKEQRAIQYFRSQAMFMRQPGHRVVVEPVSLAARREDTVPDPARATVRES